MLGDNAVSKIYNLLISKLLSYRYRIIEPILLWYARSKHAKDYLNQESPLVSIIIATYNRQEILINRTLPSVFNQTYKNIEIIVVGDRCIDNTATKILEIKDKRLRFYDLNKRGKYPVDIRQRWFVQGSKPRNVGMQLAKGEWMVFISDDDILYPKHVETLLKNAKKRNLEFISASYEAYKEGYIHRITPYAFDITRPALICGGMQTWLYRSYLKVFLWNINSWRKSYNKPVDYDLVARFFDCGVKMGWVDDVVYFNPPVEGTKNVGYLGAIESEGNGL